MAEKGDYIENITPIHTVHLFDSLVKVAIEFALENIDLFTQLAVLDDGENYTLPSIRNAIIFLKVTKLHNVTIKSKIGLLDCKSDDKRMKYKFHEKIIDIQSIIKNKSNIQSFKEEMEKTDVKANPNILDVLDYPGFEVLWKKVIDNNQNGSLDEYESKIKSKVYQANVQKQLESSFNEQNIHYDYYVEAPQYPKKVIVAKGGKNFQNGGFFS